MEASAREKPFDRAPGLNSRGTARRWISTPRPTLWTMPPHTAERYALGESKRTGKKERTMKTDRAQQKQTTLVLGGTGKTGRRVAQRLATRGVPTRVGSRSGEAPFDWENEATWAPALRDVGSVYVSCFPDLAAPGALAAVRSFAELAVKSGVRRLVLLSGRGEEEAQRAELAVQEAGAEWTIVRCAWFMQNFSENYLL